MGKMKLFSVFVVPSFKSGSGGLSTQHIMSMLPDCGKPARKLLSPPQVFAILTASKTSWRKSIEQAIMKENPLVSIR